MSDITISISNINSCKFRLSYDGYIFAYNSAKELAQLMYNYYDCIKNPYDPDSTDYEDFNETIYKLQSKGAKELVFR